MPDSARRDQPLAQSLARASSLFNGQEHHGLHHDTTEVRVSIAHEARPHSRIAMLRRKLQGFADYSRRMNTEESWQSGIVLEDARPCRTVPVLV